MQSFFLSFLFLSAGSELEVQKQIKTQKALTFDSSASTFILKFTVVKLEERR